MTQLLQLCGLWRHISKSGREYLVGRIGGVKVLVWENSDRVSNDDPTHLVMLGEPTSAASSLRSSRPEARPSRRRFKSAYQHLRPAPMQQNGAVPPLNDRINDLWREGGNGD